MRRKNWTRPFAVVLMLGLLFVAGCSEDDNPADSSGEENHLEAVGVRILDGDGMVVAEADGTELTGSITLGEGLASFYSVHFLDPDSGEWFDPEEREGGHEEGEEHTHELVVTATSTDIALITMGEDLTDAPTEWGFQLTAGSVGETTIRVEIYHEDHPDYSSPLIPVVVE